MPALIWSLLGSAFAFLVKHPFVSKMMIFTLFVSLITFVIDFIIGLVAPYISNNGLFVIAAQFGVLQGISLYITIILSGFGAKQVLAFVRST
jgi:hypothetical protein